ncbi:hypothetical protein FHR92_000624 [Fontibacillus solani]|uniref:Uncharacterized protein n=1 Tax=Fontibacillus solani TaxID=1572857 RepID=A0A7W3XQ79_9BACL|nr:hypothetical protein [Fontibacillus solani]
MNKIKPVLVINGVALLLYSESVTSPMFFGQLDSSIVM